MRYSEEQLNKFIIFLKRKKKCNRYLRIAFFLGIMLFISPFIIQVLLALPFIVSYIYTMYAFYYVIKFKKNIPSNISIVKGQSMLPTIKDGDILIKKKFSLGKSPIQKGDIIVLSSEKLITRINLLLRGNLGSNLVKRVSSVEKDGVFAIGDNQENSLDSRVFGLVNFKDIKFVITSIIEPTYWGNDKYTFRSKPLHNPAPMTVHKKDK